MVDAKLGPQTLEEAQASVRELIARLDGQIQSETEAFMAQRERILSERPESFSDQERQSCQLRELTYRLEERLYPVRREREMMANAIARVFEASNPPQFYLELQAALKPL